MFEVGSCCARNRTRSSCRQTFERAAISGRHGNALSDPGPLALGHAVRQVPPVYAKPFRQTHKMICVTRTRQAAGKGDEQNCVRAIRHAPAIAGSGHPTTLVPVPHLPSTAAITMLLGARETH